MGDYMTNKDIKDILYRCIEAIDYMEKMSRLPDSRVSFCEVKRYENKSR